MQKPYQKLPANNLSKQDHRKAGQLAKSLVSKPIQRGKDNRKHARTA